MRTKRKRKRIRLVMKRMTRTLRLNYMEKVTASLREQTCRAVRVQVAYGSITKRKRWAGLRNRKQRGGEYEEAEGEGVVEFDSSGASTKWRKRTDNGRQPNAGKKTGKQKVTRMSSKPSFERFQDLTQKRGTLTPVSLQRRVWLTYGSIFVRFFSGGKWFLVSHNPFLHLIHVVCSFQFNSSNGLLFLYCVQRYLSFLAFFINGKPDDAKKTEKHKKVIQIKTSCQKKLFPHWFLRVPKYFKPEMEKYMLFSTLVFFCYCFLPMVYEGKVQEYVVWFVWFILNPWTGTHTRDNFAIRSFSLAWRAVPHLPLFRKMSANTCSFP